MSQGMELSCLLPGAIMGQEALEFCKNSSFGDKFGPQEHPRLVEGGGRERDEAAVSARTQARRLRRPHHLHPGEAASRPYGGPRHHPGGDEKSQEGAV